MIPLLEICLLVWGQMFSYPSTGEPFNCEQGGSCHETRVQMRITKDVIIHMKKIGRILYVLTKILER